MIKDIPYSGVNGGGTHGEMTAWLYADSSDNENELRRLKRNLRLARRDELTERQREILRMNFEQNMTVTEIARELGVNKSTISRTLTRAKRRLYKCLRYAL